MSRPAVAPGLDHERSGLDPVAAADRLSRWATEALPALLGDRPASRLRPAVRPLSGLGPWLRPSLPSRRLRRRLERRAGEVMKLRAGPWLQSPLALRLGEAALEPGGGRGRLGRGPRPPISPEAWTFVGELAFSRPELHRLLVELVVERLRRRTLFAPGGAPRPEVRARTFWLLARLFATPELRRRARRRLGRGRRAARRLEAVAETQALASGWARPWDQWLVLEALEHHPAALGAASSELRFQVLSLPLLGSDARRGLAERLGRPRGLPSARIADPRAADDAPPWLRMPLLAPGAAPAPVSGGHRVRR